jgi:invasion protein IalB
MKSIACNLGLAVALLALSVFQSTLFAQDSEVTVITKSLEDWQVRCEQAKGAEKSCVMTQQAMMQASGQRLMQANVGKAGDITKMTLILPLGISLPAGAVLEIDEENKTDLVIGFCTQTGCFVNMDLNDKLIRAIGNADAVQVNIQIADGKAVSVPFSAKGFLAAHSIL